MLFCKFFRACDALRRDAEIMSVFIYEHLSSPISDRVVQEVGNEICKDGEQENDPYIEVMQSCGEGAGRGGHGPLYEHHYKKKGVAMMEYPLNRPLKSYPDQRHTCY